MALHREAALVRQISQPGLVEITGQRFDAGSGELFFARIDGPTMEQAKFSAYRLALCLRTLSATVAYLHELHYAHTRITPDHVLLSKLDGRPVLCGLSHARNVRSGDAAFADDVAALGVLIKEKLRPPHAILRDRLSQDGQDTSGNKQEQTLAGMLRELSEDATQPDASKRPTARAMALRLAALIDNPGEATASSARHWDTRNPPNYPELARAFSRRALPVLGLVAAACAVIGITWSLGGVFSPSVAAPTYAAPTCPNNGTGDVTSDVDGDGCGDAITLASGVVTVNHQPYEVGQTGDQLVLGYWNCTTPRTVALLRPSTGKVFVFDAWPSPNTQVTPRLVGTVTGARGLDVVHQANSCDLLRVAGNRTSTIDPKAAP